MRVVKAPQEQQQIRQLLLHIMLGLVMSLNTTAGVRCSWDMCAYACVCVCHVDTSLYGHTACALHSGKGHVCCALRSEVVKRPGPPSHSKLS